MAKRLFESSHGVNYGEFYMQNLIARNFWNALSSIATLSAVLVALFMPWWIQYRKANRLERLIKAEIDENLKILKQKYYSTEGNN